LLPERRRNRRKAWLEAAGTLATLQRDPHLQAVSLIGFEDHPTEGRSAAIRSTISFDGVYPSPRSPSQPRGSDTRAVLSEVGFEDGEIEELLSARAAVAVPGAAD